MTLKEALKRIEQLEREVAELKARPVVHHHHHYGAPQPYQLGSPAPVRPFMPWEVICGGNVGAISVT